MTYAIVEVDLSEPAGAIELSPSDTGVALVVRRRGRPIAFLLGEPSERMLSALEVRRWIERDTDPELLHDAGPDAPPDPLPSLTVAVCTRNNPNDLSACLERLRRAFETQPPGERELLVVDNAPSDERTRELVGSLPGVRYVREPKPGLDFARNCAVSEAKGEILAFVDDDVRVDRNWLGGLARALTDHPDAAAVTGLVLPSELATPAQVLFERRGGFEKAFRTIRYGASLPGHPFYPCVGGKFGTGCNMAFRRRVLLELDGFDEALDTGASLPGGGDTDMLYRVVRAGYPLVYEPRFLVFHRHRRELAQLSRQYSRSWAQGLMAFAAKSYRTDPEQRRNLRRLVGWWFRTRVRELRASLRGRHLLPPSMVLAELWGGIVGISIGYPRSVWRTERIRRRHSRS